MDLAAAGTVADLAAAAVIETGVGHWGFVPSHMTVMAQFIFMTASFLLEEDPGWQDQGYLQHTNMSLPCGIEHQGSLAAK